MFKTFTVSIFLSFFLFGGASAKTRIKDVSSIAGVRENFIMGYGLVSGLAATGDNLRSSVFTRQELGNLLSRFGMSISGEAVRTRNVAAVIVTASLPTFAQPGGHIDVKVSAVGDCTSLSGGVLLPTTLSGPDGMVYAIAQGAVMVQRFSPASADVRTKSNENLTTGTILGGAVVEASTDFALQDRESIDVVLHNPDFITAVAIADRINDMISGNLASAIDSTTVKVKIPKQSNVIKLIANIEAIEINTDAKALVIVNDTTGTVIIGGNVKVKPVAIAHGNMVLSIGKEHGMLRTLSSKKSDSTRGFGVQNFSYGATLNGIVEGLNRLGVLPKDLIDIIGCLKSAGALDATVEIK
ncbi:flagellar basal body P-ring protein FlgI [Candidatus Sneabacter namystus]|uniref:Flagellar P-ring protein n=1 Tax=Candidatus Sneabacter namystus TaxID=2601646 RepID=A0A5C0UIE8_9RICK|nr:flagellar basal body P-ring protein FlgI [Candidatus Sneabacter namystus]QEK39381.1 flagellar basal body P-ring protein FlgI [Candidatus Sneabacter namystus]